MADRIQQEAERAESGTPRPVSAVAEIADLRAEFVDRFIERRVNHRQGDFTTEQYVAWESQAHREWRAKYPALTAMLPTHIPEDINA